MSLVNKVPSGNLQPASAWLPTHDTQANLAHSIQPALNRMEFQDDELFIRKAMADNPKLGVELLFRRYYQPMCSHAVKYVGSKNVAEDLVSDIFYQFYQQQVFADITSSYRFYLLRTVRNRAFNYLKQQLSCQTVDESTDEVTRLAVSTGELPDSLIQFEELYHDVQEAINDLPLDRRRIYLLNRFEGMRYAQIAEELGLSVKTVEVQLYRANKQIRNLLKNKWNLLWLLVMGLH